MVAAGVTPQRRKRKQPKKPVERIPYERRGEKPPVVIGVDYSTTLICLGEITPRTPFARNHRVYINQDIRSTYQRTLAAFQQIAKDRRIIAVGIEQPWIRNDPMASMKLIRVSLLIELAASEFVIPRFIYVGTWRGHVIGKGSGIESKEAKLLVMKEMKRLGYPFEDNNDADALGIASYLCSLCDQTDDEEP